MRIAALAAVTLLSVSARAQGRTDTAAVLSAVTITASRTPHTPRSQPASVTVFDRQMLRDAGITQVADVMRLVPGATVLASGSFGSQTSLFLRGGESDYVQVLVDGVPLNAPGGAYDFGQLTLDNVDRVEVVRGPASVLYGSDAVTGVIQIFTRQGVRPGTHLSGLVGGGTYASRSYELGWTHASAAFKWSLDGAHHSTDGILPFNNEYKNTVVSGGFHWLGRRTDLAGNARWTDYTFHYPTNSSGELTDSNAFAGERRLVASMEAGVKASPRVELRARVAHDRATPSTTDRPDYAADSNSFTSHGTVTRDLLEARAIINVASRDALTIALTSARDHDDERSDSESPFGSFPSSLVATRRNTGVSAQYLGEWGRRTSVVLGLRRDDNSRFGVFTTARAALAVRASAATTLRASLGSAFKAPTFFENFATGFTVGNPSLTPERTRTWEVGLSHARPGARVTYGVTGFWQRFRDVIQYVSDVAPGAPNYANLAAASADGAELESSVRVGGGISVRGSYTYLHTEVTNAGADNGPSANFVRGDRLLRRPTHLASLDLHQSIQDYGSFDAIVTYTGSRDDRDFSQFPAVPVVMKAFTRVDLAFVTPIGHVAGMERPSLVLRVENAFKTRYQEMLGFPAPGRTVFIGVRVGD